MDIELYAFLSTVILWSTMLTMVFAVFSYLAFRARRIRIRRAQENAPVVIRPAKPLYFRRYEMSK
jgi:uncharacterized membrane protein